MNTRLGLQTSECAPTNDVKVVVIPQRFSPTFTVAIAKLLRLSRTVTLFPICLITENIQGRDWTQETLTHQCQLILTATHMVSYTHLILLLLVAVAEVAVADWSKANNLQHEIHFVSQVALALLLQLGSSHQYQRTIHMVSYTHPILLSSVVVA